MKTHLESFCTSCEWHGEGAGLTNCPICGEPITSLDIGGTEVVADEEEYPKEALADAEEDEL